MDEDLITKIFELVRANTSSRRLRVDQDVVGAACQVLDHELVDIEKVFGEYLGDDPADLPIEIQEYAEEGKEYTVKRIKGTVAHPVRFEFKQKKAPGGAYHKLVECVFFRYYNEGAEEVSFERDDIKAAASELNVGVPKNLGDVVYSFRYRRPLPRSIREKAPADKQWLIRGDGDAKYKFRLAKTVKIVPNPGALVIKVPDATPEIIGKYALKDEQALLAKVRYNRLVDIFLGITAYSLQSHLRTKVKGLGQIEIDEFYTGIDTWGQHFVVPLQAKRGSDRLAVVQTEQDLEYCRQQFPKARARAVAAQFVGDDHLVMFELGVQDEEIVLVDQRTYKLVESKEISAEDLELYARTSKPRSI